MDLPKKKKSGSVNFGFDTQLWSSFYPPNHVRTSTLEACPIMIDAPALRDTGPFIKPPAPCGGESINNCLMRLLHFKQLDLSIVFCMFTRKYLLNG